MTIKFYYAPFSTASVTQAVLGELEHGQDKPLAERISVNLLEGDAKTKDFLANVNPNGLIPVIIHDGVAIWESSAITMYLGELFGTAHKVDGVDAPLYPEAGPRRGEAMKWIAWANLHLAAHTLPLHDNVAAEIKATEKNARDTINKSLAVLESALEGKEYLLGDWYTIADTHVWSFVSYMTMLKFDLGSTPNVKAWADRVASRPQQKRTT